MFDHAICKLLGHKINRRRVWNDGIDFRTTCERCDSPLIREFGAWTAFKEAQHGNPLRSPHPRDGC